MNLCYDCFSISLGRFVAFTSVVLAAFVFECFLQQSAERALNWVKGAMWPVMRESGVEELL
jgi:hypothetical protein